MLLVEYVTFILVFLKTFVTALASLPQYVNFDQCVFSVLFCFLELDIDSRTDAFNCVKGLNSFSLLSVAWVCLSMSLKFS